jgi:hypothetical protein
MAQFSQRAITPQHRAQAAEALQSSLENLRSVSSPASTEFPGSLAEVPA